MQETSINLSEEVLVAVNEGVGHTLFSTIRKKDVSAHFFLDYYFHFPGTEVN